MGLDWVATCSIVQSLLIKTWMTDKPEGGREPRAASRKSLLEPCSLGLIAINGVGFTEPRISLQ
jgi:hypothetical protein